MKAIQLELFKEETPQKKHTYIKKLQRRFCPISWFFIDDVIFKKSDYRDAFKQHRLAVSMSVKEVYSTSSPYCKLAPGDSQSQNINIYDYFKIGQVLKNCGWLYNKKLGESVIKK